MRRMNNSWSFIFILFAFAVQAEPPACKIEMADLTEIMQSTDQGEAVTPSVLTLTDPYGEGPIRRYVQNLMDGSMLILEQKHCLIYNLTATLLLPNGLPIDTAPRRLGNILEKTPVWKKWFDALDAEAILRQAFDSGCFDPHVIKSGNLSFNLMDKIKTPDENSEAFLKVDYLDFGTVPFTTIVSIYIGVGGL